MNTTAANQADRQIEPVTGDPLNPSPPRWSTDDDLLVWTVSRIEGGRRHGVERDCHVVYGLSRGYFVEQTRKFRASAEQCIEMLQQGRRAGTTQRKIALDTIIALKSDPRSGRLQIRTLNGTHQLEPISNEEADILREIASELELRMPAGGASFDDYSGPVHNQRRRTDQAGLEDDLEARERRALAALENARSEDVPDEYVAPDYDVAGTVAADAPVEADVPAEVAHVELIDPSPVSNSQLERIAAAVHAEMGPESEGDVPALPDDITVAGGVNITFEPAPEHIESTQHIDPASMPIEQPAYQEAPVAQVSPEPLATSIPDLHQGAPMEEPAPAVPEVSIPGQEVFDRRTDVGNVPENFDRRQQRAIRRQMEGSEPTPAVDPSALPGRDSDPSSGLDLPAGAVFEPIVDAVPSAHAPSAFDSPHLSTPAMTPAFEESALVAPTEVEGDDRRQAEDPSFPSVFDRRCTQSARTEAVPGWARFDDGPRDPTGVESAVDDTSEEVVVSSEEPDTPLADGPPTLAAPVAGAGTVVTGGAVGFNPDFDVNPFR